jgi:hypothetical protein
LCFPCSISNPNHKVPKYGVISKQQQKPAKKQMVCHGEKNSSIGCAIVLMREAASHTFLASFSIQMAKPFPVILCHVPAVPEYGTKPGNILLPPPPPPPALLKSVTPPNGDSDAMRSSTSHNIAYSGRTMRQSSLSHGDFSSYIKPKPSELFIAVIRHRRNLSTSLNTK